MDVNGVGTSLLRNQKDMTVHTDSLYIQGHLLKWENVVVQICNISSITVSNIPVVKYAKYWLYAALLVGFFGVPNVFSRYSSERKAGFFLLAIAAALLVIWYKFDEKEQKNAKKLRCMTISLNSGSAYSIVFQDESFLLKVLHVFANIFEEGSQVGVNYHINLTGCTIDNQSSVVSGN